MQATWYRWAWKAGLAGAMLQGLVAMAQTQGGGGPAGGGTGPGTGTVTSVCGDGTVLSGSNCVTTAGALTVASAPANSVLAGPATGGAAAPSYQTAPAVSIGSMTGTCGTCVANSATLDLPLAGGTLVGVNATSYAGADLGAQINAAYAALPSGGGTIVIPPGTYSFATAIACATVNKPCLIAGVSTNATILNYTGTGTAITLNCCQSAVGLQWGVTGLTLAGPGTSGSTIGILLGGTNGAFGATLSNLVITDTFTTNIQFASNAWLDTLNRVHSYTTTGGKALYYPSGLTNSGETISIHDSVFSTIGGFLANCVSLAGYTTATDFVNTSFDSCQLNQTLGLTNLTNTHHEDNQNNPSVPYIVISGGQMSFNGGDFLQNASTGSVPAEFVSVSSAATFTASSPHFDSNETMSYCFAASGTSSLVVNQPVQAGVSACTTFLSNTSSGYVHVAQPFTGPQITTYTSGSGTYTTPLGALYLKVRLVGGGGGGAGSGSSGGNGGNANSSSFGASLVAGGGQGSNWSSDVGGTGGTATGGQINIPGATGGSGAEYATYCAGTSGGSSPFGGAGPGGQSQAIGYPATANSGSGGGAAGAFSTAGCGGGGGAGGYVESTLASPLVSYSYVVGSAGAGGAAGGSGYAGGAGAAGIVIVEAYFQ